MKITTLKSISGSVAKDLHALSTELHGTKKKDLARIRQDLKELLKNPHAVTMVAKDGHRIVGMAMLFVLQKVGKRGGTVEDVVVLSEYRGKGIGESLMRAVIKEARKRKLSSLQLTSRPSRVAANRLYNKLGFAKKDTNAYRLKFRG